MNKTVTSQMNVNSVVSTPLSHQELLLLVK